MERTWKPTAAGILCIIVGVIVMVPAMAGALFFDYIGRGWWSYMGIPFIATPLIIMGIIAIVAIVGGIYALRRRIWRLALAGSIALVVIGILPILRTKNFIGFIGCVILGILAIIFVILGKREFE